MTINGSNFIYAGQSSEEFGVIMVDFQQVESSSNDEVNDLILSTTPYKNTWSLHAVQKSEPLKFRITICMADGSFIDAFQERELKRWMCKHKFNWLSIEQDDLYDCQYRIIAINPQKVNVGRMNGGMSFECVCDSQNAWTNLKKKTYTTVNGTLNFNLNCVLDFDEYTVYPNLIITPVVNGTIAIKNNITKETIEITNCISNEVITLECGTDKIISSNGRNIIEDWNKRTMGLVEGTNNINLTGNFKLEIQFRLPVRVGA